jgi:hypothetical protein
MEYPEPPGESRIPATDGAQNSEPNPAPTDRLELARYRASDGPRRLVAHRIADSFRVVDSPLSGSGPIYTVETCIPSIEELEALTADYRHQAAELGDCPMRAGQIDPAESSAIHEAIS